MLLWAAEEHDATLPSVTSLQNDLTRSILHTPTVRELAPASSFSSYPTDPAGIAHSFGLQYDEGGNDGCTTDRPLSRACNHGSRSHRSNQPHGCREISPEPDRPW
ncbi:hypothetical protein BST61_g4958 [Cercospora zeina]